MNFPPKELATDQCYYTFEAANSTVHQAPREEFHSIYKISYMWYTMVGAISTMLVAFICSFAFGLNDPTTISPDLITPLLSKRIFKNQKESAERKLSPAAMKDTEF